MHTTEKQTSDIRALTDAELNEVSGGRDDYELFYLGAVGAIFFFFGEPYTLNAGLHR